ncbi:HV01 protein, partial [Rhynochetos jubatus]|nr:HV01 protein [Rhynochetos jubatus]
RVVGAEAGGGRRRAPGYSWLLSCRASGITFGNCAVRWYRHAHGGRPEWVSYISLVSSVITYGPAVEGRATMSRGNSRSESSVSPCALHPKDSARYFCAVHTGTGNSAEL